MLAVNRVKSHTWNEKDIYEIVLKTNNTNNRGLSVVCGLLAVAIGVHKLWKGYSVSAFGKFAFIYLSWVIFGKYLLLISIG